MKLLSVIVPSYNMEKYIDRCLSTLAIPDLEGLLEVIVVNDGSIDGTEKIATEYLEKYPEIFILINKKNGGHGSAVNAGIERSSSKYLRVVDSDDWVDSQQLTEFVKLLKTTDADVISTHYHRVNMDTGVSEPVWEEGVEFNKVYDFEELNGAARYYSIHSSTFKTSIFIDNNIRLQENTFFVDVEYTTIPFAYLKTTEFFDLYVYKYFVGNEDQSVSIPNMVKRYDHHDRVVRRVLSFTAEHDMRPQAKRYVYSIMTKVIKTHFSISSFYSSDSVTGAKLSQDFDRFFKKTDPVFYNEYFGSSIWARNLRKYDFYGSAASKDFSFRLMNKARKLLIKFKVIKGA